MSEVSLRKIYETESGEKKTVVLWVSRHQPLRAQIEELEKKLGPVEVWQLSGTIPSAEFIVDVVKKTKAQYVVPVLPLSMIARLSELSKKGFTVLWAEMQQVSQVTGTPPDIDKAR